MKGERAEKIGGSLKAEFVIIEGLPDLGEVVVPPIAGIRATAGDVIEKGLGELRNEFVGLSDDLEGEVDQCGWR